MLCDIWGMIKNISSLQNATIKNLLNLQAKARNRRRDGLFVLEGVREIERAIDCGYKIYDLFFNEDWRDAEIEKFESPDRNLLKVSTAVFSKLAYRESVKNMVAVAEIKSQKLENIDLPKNPIIVVLETIEKPGNLGAVLRSADGAGVDLIIVCDQKMDIYNPNVIRNSLGGFFNVPTVQCASAEAILFLRKNNVQIFATYLKASLPYYNVDLKLPTALVMGSEAFGITDLWVNAADQNIIIPMRGIIDSLNVSNAASIVMFEAARQRSLE